MTMPTTPDSAIDTKAMMLLCRTIIFLKMYARGAMLKLTKRKLRNE